MSLRCFLVLVCIAMVHQSFALKCHNVFNIDTTTCDECIRCGGIWCRDPAEEKHCKKRNEANDGWCRKEQENKHLSVEPNARQGKIFDPRYVEKLAHVNMGTMITLNIRGSIFKPYYTVLNSTQLSGKPLVELTVDDQNPSELTVTTTIPEEFCSPTSAKFEYVFIEVGIDGVGEKAVLKYHVPCACGCSEVVEVNSQTCTLSGNLTCGSCQCNDDKDGKYCQKRKCPSRGDVSTSCLPTSDNKQCSGNGYCDECSVCHCNNSISLQGSQYLHPEDDCIDLCSAIKKCDECLMKDQTGLCEGCETGRVIFEKMNLTLLAKQFDSYRKTWVNCSEIIDGCGEVEYSATESAEGKRVMVRKRCNGETGSRVNEGTEVTIPIVIGVIAAIAAMVAAAAGYVAWKGKGALPAAGSNYANIGPEDSVSENPLYKPPTSSFKNPMFGKS